MGGVLPGFFSLLAWAIFLGATALALVLGFILSFHWYRYSSNQNVAFISTLVYGGGCLLILALLLGAVISAA
ncbi:hypothetical protein A2765_01170 [Candidatus Kaiserbacteria bacterium RIFCSPHIGHO2_01_FULL_56_24]|uniref:Uncharacterized protein n=1 Tax=Candidatus Kaiserbacteria bacterium RIFCSPHIGHO2_01_FULL_56_24 TaxID=1798487 RepID=A0A1F6DGJ8_9BACT|nr:MAG: hypothetical protein A2765_01170 [Candidatus Kaiserbacteria bacterium RIFCSPHIGHO2_01_FULL_56_24]